MEYIVQDQLLNEMIINSYLRDRTVYLCSEIDREVGLKVNYMLDKIVQRDIKQGIEPKNSEPIKIKILSYGGTIYDSLAIISKIEELKDKQYEIHTICESVACSGGFKVFMVGSKRFASRHSTLMVHSPNQEEYGTVTLQEKKENYDHMSEEWEYLKDLIVKYTNITREQLNDITKRKFDWYMRPIEAKQLGIVDIIL